MSLRAAIARLPGLLVLTVLALALLWPAPTAPVAAIPAPRAVPPATCGPGDAPETDLQGRVPIGDRDSGRSRHGYRCNLSLLGQYQGQGTTWVNAFHDDCAYQAQAAPSSLLSPLPGVHVVDVADPRHPRLTDRLTSPALLGGPWESMKVNEARGLLAGTFVGIGAGTLLLDVWDVGTDCSRPRLLSSTAGTDLGLPPAVLAHEGGFSPDGRTYWSTAGGPGVISAIDLDDPTGPRLLHSEVLGTALHGLDVSPDGRRLYLANISPPGLRIIDVSDIQDRRPQPRLHEVGSLYWSDGENGQQAIGVTWDGVPHVVFVDELEQGAARIIDISDETAPRIISHLRLEIHLPEHAALREVDGAGNGLFDYDAHYCAVDRPADPTALACGYFSSGVRVFDVRDPRDPREIAYFNPPAQVGRAGSLPGSDHAQGILAGGVGPLGLVDLTTDWCTSPPRFVGRDQLWVHCTDNGLLVLRFRPGTYPLPAGGPPR